MAAGQVARRYAQAWLSAAADKKATEAVAADCAALLAMIKNSTDLRAFLSSPLSSKADQAKVMAVLAKQAKLHDVTANLLGVMAGARRLPLLGDVLDAAHTMIDAASGTLKAQVTSASVLDESKITAIRTQLTRKMGTDVAVETHVDPSIIGGLVVRVGSKMIDDSVKTKLERLARKLHEQSAA